MVCIAGDKHQLQPLVRRPETAGGLHAVHFPQFHVQKEQVQLPGMAAVPLQQCFARRKLEILRRHISGVQDAFQRRAKNQTRIRQIVADPNSQHSDSPCW